MRLICQSEAAGMYEFQSTHPLRGATIAKSSSLASTSNFNPRTPCGVRLKRAISPIMAKEFQSTHPLRGATLPRGRRRPRQKDFNPRTPCGVRLFTPTVAPTAWKFQSTHPLRGATVNVFRLDFAHMISIHAPLAGCDRHKTMGGTALRGISIHAPLAGCDRALV